MGCMPSKPPSKPRTPTPSPPTPPPPTPPPPTPPRRETTSDFKSNCVNIRIDTRTDENKIQSKESGYPAPVAPTGDAIKKNQKWFDDDDFNNASDDADLFNTETAVDDEDIDIDTLSDDITEDVNRKRKVQPPTSSKPILSYEDIDEHARNAQNSLIESFADLTTYLTEHLKTDRFKKIKTARAIVVWLSHQKMEGIDYGTKSLDTPRGLLQYLKEEKMTYTTCYTILCRKAGLQCVIIKGHVKAAGYQPGDTSVPETTWSAVYVESGWQIVHAFWICRALFGHNLGGWVKVETDGTSMRKKEHASSGIVRNTFNDYYFMPPPDEFIYRCRAVEKEWQLVPNQAIINSLDDFMKMPYIFNPFFGIGLKLASEPKCVLHSRDGFCKVEIKAKSSNAHQIVLKYELFMKVDEGGAESFSSIQQEEMSRMVFNSRAAETFAFDIRFPRKGTFKLVIYGGPYKSPALRLCEFKIECEKEIIGQNLLPLDCHDIGWGPGPVANEAGLLMPSKPSGLIPVSDREKKSEVRFQLHDMNDDYAAAIHGEVGGRRRQLDENEVEITKNKHLHQIVFTFTIPDKGEYGLAIHHVTKVRRSKQNKNVCNYLVSTLAFKPEKANVKLAKQKLRDTIAENVEPRQWKQQIDNIESCIDKCKKEKVSDSDDEIISANAMKWFLTCKDMLRDCILRRNLNVIKKTLWIVSKYKNQDALTREVTSVKKVEEELTALRGFVRQVPKLEEANKEIVALKHAQDEVVNTFTALLVLLGESEQNLQGWSDIQSRMKASTHTADATVLGKMKSIQKEAISQDRVKKASEILHRYNDAQVRKVNSDAHSFYEWTENIIKIHTAKRA